MLATCYSHRKRRAKILAFYQLIYFLPTAFPSQTSSTYVVYYQQYQIIYCLSMRGRDSNNFQNNGVPRERVKPERQPLREGKFQPNRSGIRHLRDPLRQTQTQIDSKKLNMRKIMAAVDYGERNIEMGEPGGHVVVCWGPTGAGKSSSILTLSGEQMLGYHNKGNPIMMNKDSIAFDVEHHQQMVENQEVQTKIFIQEKAVSGTKYPISKTMQTGPGQDSVKLWDTAGFSDNTGHTQTLINAYFLNRIFTLHHKVKLVFCINYASLAVDLKGQYFKNDIMRLTEILKDFPNYNKSMALMVTKVAQTAGKNDIKDMIKENMEVIMSQDRDNQELKRFHRYVKSNEMNVIILRRPQLHGKVSQNSPVEVTHQYQEFKRQFYEMVTTKLAPADFPTITVPAGLSPEERRQCQDLAIETSSTIKEQINEFVDRLSNFISQYYCFGAITDQEKENRDNFNRVNSIKSFLNNMSKIVDLKGLDNRQSYSKRLSTLTALFERPQFSFECEQIDGKLSCVPLKDLNNSFIIIQFLQSIQLGDRCDGVRYEVMIEVLFEAFQKEIRSKKITSYDEQLLSKLDNYVLSRAIRHIQNWEKQSIFRLWKEGLKQFPSFILRAIKFNPHRHDLLDYFKHIRDTEDQFGIRNRLQTDTIKQMLVTCKESLGERFDPGALLKNEVAPMVIKAADNMMRGDLQFDGWGDQEIMEVFSEGNKSIEQAHLLRLARLQSFIINKHKGEVKHHYELRDQIERNHKEKLRTMDSDYLEMLEQIERAKREREALKKQNSRLKDELNDNICCNVM